MTKQGTKGGAAMRLSASAHIILLSSTALATAMLGGSPAAAQAEADPVQAQPGVSPASAAQAGSATQQGQPIRAIRIEGNQRFEDATILSYLPISVGDPYTARSADDALRALYQTELFSNVQIGQDDGVVIIDVVENPVVNRVLVEGNKSLKDDKILPEIKLSPRQIFTRSKVRADVARIIELYKRSGRFSATVEPQMVQLDQNRVDVVFEIEEGPKSKVRQINIIGNEAFDDGDLRGEMLTKQTGLFTWLTGGTTYDPDKLAYDQQKLRQFYLTEGYADFRVVSAVAELTPDKEDFIITYVVEEGERYKFGDVGVESALRDLTTEELQPLVSIEQGDWYNAEKVENTVERFKETAGLYGYATAAVNPRFQRNPDDLTMDVTFAVEPSPRVYIDEIRITGNSTTRDKVIRREMRVAEGDVFNSYLIDRSENRLRSLGYFQEDLKIQRVESDEPGEYDLIVDVEEGNTGELQLSAGYSSIERFIFSGSIKKRNFRGLGQELRASATYSKYSKAFQLGFTEPYLFGRNVALAGDIFRRDYNSFNYFRNDRRTTYENDSTGFQIRAGLPFNEYLYFSGRYGLSYEDVSLDEDRFYTDRDSDGDLECDPLLAGRYLCDAVGKRWISTLGASLVYDLRDNSYRPTSGHSVTLSADFAGLGGDVKYLKGEISADKYWDLGGGFIFSVKGEGGYIHPLENRGNNVDDIRLTDRFFLGEPQLRGFDIRGVGPRVIRYRVNSDGTIDDDRDNAIDDALGGKAYYLGRVELEIPLGSGADSLGLRPSVFLDAGSVFSIERPQLTRADAFRTTDANGNTAFVSQCILGAGGTTPAVDDPATTEVDFACPAGTINAIAPFDEQFFGDTWKPRVSIGVGVNWQSPFGPFRIDFAQELIKQEGDDTKRFSFNVGTSFR